MQSTTVYHLVITIHIVFTWELHPPLPQNFRNFIPLHYNISSQTSILSFRLMCSNLVHFNPKTYELKGMNDVLQLPLPKTYSSDTWIRQCSKVAIWKVQSIHWLTALLKSHRKHSVSSLIRAQSYSIEVLKLLVLVPWVLPLSQEKNLWFQLSYLLSLFLPIKWCWYKGFFSSCTVSAPFNLWWQCLCQNNPF